MPRHRDALMAEAEQVHDYRGRHSVITASHDGLKLSHPILFVVSNLYFRKRVICKFLYLKVGGR